MITVGHREMTVSADSPDQLDTTVMVARHHWRTDLSTYFPTGDAADE